MKRMALLFVFVFVTIISLLVFRHQRLYPNRQTAIQCIDAETSLPIIDVRLGSGSLVADNDDFEMSYHCLVEPGKIEVFRNVPVIVPIEAENYVPTSVPLNRGARISNIK